MLSAVADLVDLAARTPAAVVLVLAALVLAVESGTAYGELVPGTTVAAGLGAWSALGGHGVPVATAAAAAGTVAGAHVGWWRGRRGAPLPRTVARSARVTTAVDRAGSRVFGRSGPATSVLVAAGHWASALRPLLPRVAGAAGVPYRRVGPAVLASGPVWAGTLVGLGAWVGPHAASAVPWGGALAAVLVAGSLFLRSTRGRSQGGTGPRSLRTTCDAG